MFVICVCTNTVHCTMYRTIYTTYSEFCLEINIISFPLLVFAPPFHRKENAVKCSGAMGPVKHSARLLCNQ
jgi:hypothetical protein